MSVQSPIRVRFAEDSTAELLCRLSERSTKRGAPGIPFVQADITSIALTCWDMTANAVVTNFSAIALTVANVVFDTLQPWDVDDQGYNFKYTLAATAMPTGNSTYRVIVKWTLADGRVGITRWQGVAEAIGEAV